MCPCPSDLHGPLPNPQAWPAGAPCRLEAQTSRDATSQGPRQVTLCAWPPAAPTKHRPRCLGPEAAPSRPTDHGHAGGGRPAPPYPRVLCTCAQHLEPSTWRGVAGVRLERRAGPDHSTSARPSRNDTALTSGSTLPPAPPVTPGPSRNQKQGAQPRGKSLPGPDVPPAPAKLPPPPRSPGGGFSRATPRTGVLAHKDSGRLRALEGHSRPSNQTKVTATAPASAAPTKGLGPAVGPKTPALAPSP